MIIEKISLLFFKLKWRLKNRHNGTLPVNQFDMRFVNVGNGTYGNFSVLMHNSLARLYIGHYCSIASGVIFVLNSEHDYHKISTFPFRAKYLGIPEAVTRGDIQVGDDVWIGTGAIILSGVKIGQGAVIGAGAVVTKDVPPYGIAVGNPAKIIKYRFDSETIDRLLQIDYGRLTPEVIRKQEDKLYASVDKTSDFSFMMREE